MEHAPRRAGGQVAPPPAFGPHADEGAQHRALAGRLLPGGSNREGSVCVCGGASRCEAALRRVGKGSLERGEDPGKYFWSG